MLSQLLNLTALADHTAANPALRQTLLQALITLIAVLVVVIVGIVALKVIQARARHHARRALVQKLSIPVYLLAVVIIVFILFCLNRLSALDNVTPQPSESTQESTETQETNPTTLPTDPSTEPSTEPPTEPPTEPSFPADAHHTDKSDPSIWGVDWEIIYNESLTDSYERQDKIFFDSKGSYFDFPGVATFRGNHYRNSATYGTATVVNEKLERIWEREISALPKSESAGTGFWTGAGWTGQPLVVKWDEETKQMMNIYPSMKAKTDLVEVIYATLDGHIYFYELESGAYTRDPLFMGMAFKGSGALDPRGYPILYVGSGDRNQDWKAPRMFVISLIDFTILYERGHEESFNHRSWRAFDSCPLVHAKTDTLIWPGENGLLYTIKLNTDFDKENGTISVSPDNPVMTRYTTDLDRTLGYEASTVIVEDYIYIGDNGGMFFCIDINTMELKWSQFIHDDLNATPVFGWGDDGNGYLYLGTSMEYSEGTVYLYKLNALTGEIVWEKTITDVVYNKAISGGVLSSPLLGKKGTELEGLVLFHVAKTPSYSNGVLVALDCETGEEVWSKTMDNYTWSSPVAIYTDDGRAYVVLCDSAGAVHLIDGKNGETLDKISIDSNVEASPVVYEDTLVVGTRGQWVYGVKIS